MSLPEYRQRAVQVLASVVLAFTCLAAAPIAEDVWTDFRPGPLATAPGSPRSVAAEGDVVARLTVARLDLDLAVREGIADTTLARGGGHLVETALPGEEAARRECVIAVARGPESAGLGRLRLGESVRITTPGGARMYTVAGRRVVAPSDLRLGSASEPRILLWTPYPAGTLGPAPRRLTLFLKADGSV